jgi:ubiquinone/menaquinone biosynthesis C-methylase UbiE
MEPERKDPTERFSGLSQQYAKYRPAYPAEAVERILSTCGWMPGDVVADIGCGTGISSRQLADTGLVVIGIEPNEEMRSQAEQLPHPKVTYREGQAERTGLSSGSVRGVVCAQAFHWFDVEPSLAEFHRILAEDGWLVLLWNERDSRDPATIAYSEVITAHPEAAAQERRRQAAGGMVSSSPLFAPAIKYVFAHEQRLTREELLGRAFSVSYAPTEQTGQERWRTGLERVFDEFEESGIFRLAYVTSVYLFKRTNPSRGSIPNLV